MRSLIRPQPLNTTIGPVLAATLAGMLLMVTSLAAQEVGPNLTDGPELVSASPDFWLYSAVDEVAFYTADGELLGVAAPGTWFKSVLEEDGWALVYSENDPDLLVWIPLEAVISNDFAAEDPTTTEPFEQLFEAATSVPTAAPVPTASSTPIGTTTPGPSATPPPTVPIATSAIAATFVPTSAPDPTASPTLAVATPTATTAPPTATRTSTPAPTQAPASASVNMQDNSFNPSSVTIRVGGTVTWNYSTGTSIHNATSTSGPTSFSTPNLTPGQSAPKVFTAPGLMPTAALSTARL